jgi:hypothetical protein
VGDCSSPQHITSQWNDLVVESRVRSARGACNVLSRGGTSDQNRINSE